VTPTPLHEQARGANQTSQHTAGYKGVLLLPVHTTI